MAQQVVVTPAMRNISTRIYAVSCCFNVKKSRRAIFHSNLRDAGKNNTPQKNVTVLTMSIHIIISKYHILYKRLQIWEKNVKKNWPHFFGVIKIRLVK